MDPQPPLVPPPKEYTSSLVLLPSSCRDGGEPPFYRARVWEDGRGRHRWHVSHVRAPGAILGPKDFVGVSCCGSERPARPARLAFVRVFANGSEFGTLAKYCLVGCSTRARKVGGLWKVGEGMRPGSWQRIVRSQAHARNCVASCLSLLGCLKRIDQKFVCKASEGEIL